MNEKNDLLTIREINQRARLMGLSKIFTSYQSLYRMIREGGVPVVKAGNRYLLRICDVESYLRGQMKPASGVRRID